MHLLDYILFQIYPYIAGSVFLFGSLARYDMSQYTWKTNSSQLLNNSILFQTGSYLFHAGIIFLFFGHLIGLLMPPALYPYFGLTAHRKQLLAMIAGGLAGMAVLIGGSILLYRRLFHRLVRAQSLRGDTFILSLLLVQVLFGLGTIGVDSHNLSGAVMERLVHWAEHIVTFQPGASAYLTHVYWVFKVHLFLGLTIFLCFPFTRLVHIWSVPYRYVGRRYQLVRQYRNRSDQQPAGRV